MEFWGFCFGIGPEFGALSLLPLPAPSGALKNSHQLFSVQHLLCRLRSQVSQGLWVAYDQQHGKEITIFRVLSFVFDLVEELAPLVMVRFLQTWELGGMQHLVKGHEHLGLLGPQGTPQTSRQGLDGQPSPSFLGNSLGRAKEGSQRTPPPVLSRPVAKVLTSAKCTRAS